MSVRSLHSSAESRSGSPGTGERLQFSTASVQIECVMPLLYGNDGWFVEADFVTFEFGFEMLVLKGQLRR